MNKQTENDPPVRCSARLGIIVSSLWVKSLLLLGQSDNSRNRQIGGKHCHWSGSEKAEQRALKMSGKPACVAVQRSQVLYGKLLKMAQKIIDTGKQAEAIVV